MSNLAVLRRRLAPVVGIGLLTVIAAVHLLYAHGYYVFVPYVGLLFYATVAAAACASVGLARGARVWGWALGVLLAASALAGYVASRTIGLPMFPVLPWQDPFGLAALAAEALFILLGVAVLRRPTRGGGPLALPVRRRVATSNRVEIAQVPGASTVNPAVSPASKSK
jgi:hypothetical protein